MNRYVSTYFLHKDLLGSTVETFVLYLKMVDQDRLTSSVEGLTIIIIIIIAQDCCSIHKAIRDFLS